MRHDGPQTTFRDEDFSRVVPQFLTRGTKAVCVRMMCVCKYSDTFKLSRTVTDKKQGERKTVILLSTFHACKKHVRCVLDE